MRAVSINEKQYSEDVSVANQLQSEDVVKIDYRENPQQAFSFMDKITSENKLSILPPVTLEVDHGDTISGMRIKKQASSLQTHIVLANALKKLIELDMYMENKFRELLNAKT